MKVITTLGKMVLSLIVLFGILFGLGYILTYGEYTVPATVDQDPSLPAITIDGYKLCNSATLQLCNFATLQLCNHHVLIRLNLVSYFYHAALRVHSFLTGQDWSNLEDWTNL